MKPLRGRFGGTQRPLREGGGRSTYPPSSIEASAGSYVARLLCVAIALMALLPRAAHAQQRGGLLQHAPRWRGPVQTARGAGVPPEEENAVGVARRRR